MDITKITAALLNAYTDNKGSVDKDAVKSEAESLGISMLKDEGAEVDGAGYEEALQKFIEKVEQEIKHEELTNMAFQEDLKQQIEDFKTITGPNDTLKEAYEELIDTAKDGNVDEFGFKSALIRFMSTMQDLQNDKSGVNKTDSFYQSLEMGAMEAIRDAEAGKEEPAKESENADKTEEPPTLINIAKALTERAKNEKTEKNGEAENTESESDTPTLESNLKEIVSREVAKREAIFGAIFGDKKTDTKE